MTIEEARERYKRHLARLGSDDWRDSPYWHVDGIGGFWHSDLMKDQSLLARSACEAGEDGARYQWLAANDWLDNFVMDTRGIEPRNKRTLDAAIDAARKGVRG
jgi:hypothetical protein